MTHWTPAAKTEKRATPQTGAFADKNVGTAKPVTVTGYSLSGADAGNYTLVQPTGLTANITPLDLQVTGISALGKVYDATTAASIIRYGSLLGDASTDTDNRYYASDRVKLLTDGANARFSDSNAGVGKTVTLTGLALSNSNYILEQCRVEYVTCNRTHLIE